MPYNRFKFERYKVLVVTVTRARQSPADRGDVSEVFLPLEVVFIDSRTVTVVRTEVFLTKFVGVVYPQRDVELFPTTSTFVSVTKNSIVSHCQLTSFLRNCKNHRV